MTIDIKPPRRATLDSVNNYLEKTDAGFFLDFDPTNNWNLTKYEPLENERGRRFVARTLYSTPRQFLDAWLEGGEYF